MRENENENENENEVEVEPASSRPTGDGGSGCPRCGSALHRRHCKYVCPHHGVVVDCSDPFAF